MEMDTTSNTNSSMMTTSTATNTSDTIPILNASSTVDMSRGNSPAFNSTMNNSEVRLPTTTATEVRLPTNAAVDENSATETGAVDKAPPFFSNTYAAKKTVAQGMMDIALITANANQLKYLLDFGMRESRSFQAAFAFIILSLILQVLVGFILIFKRRYDVRGESKKMHSIRLNNYIVGFVFLITIINVFITAFSIDGMDKNPCDDQKPVQNITNNKSN